MPDKRFSLKRRAAAFFLMICVAVTAIGEPPVWSQTAPKLSPVQAPVSLPANIGTVVETFSGKSSFFVILIEDAHAIPEAQNHIRQIITHYAKSEPLSFVALEGAPSSLDALFFNAFPDRPAAEALFKDYLSNSEMTGSSAALLIDRVPVPFQGVEDWVLYQQGMNHFLQGHAEQTALHQKLSVLEQTLIEKKKALYPELLLELDQRWNAFEKDEADFYPFFKKLISILPPSPESLLSLLAAEEEKQMDADELAIAVKDFSVQVKKALNVLPAEKRSSAFPSFHRAWQRFSTSQMTAASFASFLIEVSGKYDLDLKIPPLLGARSEHQKRLRDIEGTQLFEELLAHFQSAKEKLFENHPQRELDLASQKLQTVLKLIRFQITRRDYEALEAWRGSLPFEEELAAYFSFYQNALQREEAILENFLRLARLPASERRGGILISGGFHTKGFAEAFKHRGISYQVLRPAISHLPDEIPYTQQMHGRVSWRSYLEPDSEGNISLYDAFARHMRDRLLGESRLPKNHLLKHWRDEILRALSAQNRLTESGEHTRFLDELVLDAAGQAALEKTWLENIETFIETLRHFKNRDEPLNYAGLAAQLPHSTMAVAYKAAALDKTAALTAPPAYFAAADELLPETESLVQPPETGIPAIARSESRQVEQYREVQGISQYVVYKNPRKHIYAHISTRDHRKHGESTFDLRGFLRNGFEGFRIVMTENPDIEIILSENVRAAEFLDEKTGQPMRGFEFDVQMFYNGSGNHSLMLSRLESSTGRYIRDMARASMGVDPIAKRDLAELEEQGEKITPTLRGQETNNGVQIQPHRGKTRKSLTYENTLQNGSYHTLLSFFFPPDFEILPDGPNGDTIEIRGPPEREGIRFTIRFASDHPALTPYTEKQLFLPEFFEFRDKLLQKLYRWEQSLFTVQGFREHANWIEEYEKLLIQLKASPADSNLISEITAFEKKMKTAGAMKPNAGAANDLPAEAFTDLALFKYDTVRKMSRAIEFLFTHEAVLAGSWQYLTYFGRDSILSGRVLQKYVQPQVFERIFQSILRRVNEQGEVAHEEDLRRTANDPKRLDYRMMDGEFMLLKMAADFLSVPEHYTGAERRTFLRKRQRFLEKQTGTGADGNPIRNQDILNRVLSYVLKKSREETFTGLKHADPETGIGDPTGNWRDAINSMARTFYPGDVNVEWVQTALSSAVEIRNALGQMNLRLPVFEKEKVDEALLQKWKNNKDAFLITISHAEHRDRILNWTRWALLRGGETSRLALAFIARRHHPHHEELRQSFFREWSKRLGLLSPDAMAAFQIRPRDVEQLLEIYRAILEKDSGLRASFAYYALGKNRKGQNITAVNGDFSTFAPFNRILSLAELKIAMQAALKPAELGGLRLSGVGLLTANPMLTARWNESPVRLPVEADQPADIWDMLDQEAYHGIVVWPSMVNLMLVGWVHQIRALLQKGYRDEARMVYAALGLLRGDMNRSGGLKNQEVLALTVDPATGTIHAAPYSDGIESNDLQAWNAASEITLQMELEELDAEMSTAYGESIRDLWHRSRHNDPEIKEQIYQWLESPARSESRDEIEFETLADGISDVALALSPSSALRRTASPIQVDQGLQTIDEALADEEITLEDVRFMMRTSIRQSLSRLRRQGFLIQDDDVYRLHRQSVILEKKRALLHFLDQRMKRVGNKPSDGITLGLQLDQKNHLGARSAFKHYAAIFSGDLNHYISRLLVNGKPDPEDRVLIHSAGIHLGTEKRMAKAWLPNGQHRLPVIFTEGQEIIEPSPKLIWVGLRLGEVDDDIEELARLTQSVYAVVSGWSDEDAMAGESLRQDLVHALLARENYPPGFDPVHLIQGGNGRMIVDATVLHLVIDHLTEQSFTQSA